MPLSPQHITELGRGAAYSFAKWPNPLVAPFGAGVYTIWHPDGRFIYVGMSGRGITAETTRRNTPQGLYTCLQSHTSGRRSGDQFCVYVADRLVLPALSPEDINAMPQDDTKWTRSCADTFRNQKGRLGTPAPPSKPRQVTALPQLREGNLSSNSTILGAAGEHYVMCQLLRRGLIAALAPTGVPHADIIVTDQSGDQLCAIQVKVRRDIGRDGGWHMKAKHEEIVWPKLFYCFVELRSKA
jgi:hypothetical protein